MATEQATVETKPERSHPHKSTTNVEKFRHIKMPLHMNGKDFLGGTVFFRYEKQPEGLEPILYASVARCSDSDNWCRQTGRVVSRRRYFSGKRVGNPLNNLLGDSSWYDLAVQIYRGAVV